MSNTKGKKSRTKKSLAKSKAKNSLPKTDKKDTENIAKKTVQEEKQNILLDAEAIVDNVKIWVTKQMSIRAKKKWLSKRLG